MIHSALHDQMVSKRNEILRRLAAVGGELGAREQPRSADSGERAIELENLDVLFELDAATRLELGQINHTLEKIEAGTYGICSSCGKPIDPRRLQALPYAETCIACAA